MEESNRRFPRVSKLYLISFVNREDNQQRTPLSMGRVLDVSAMGIGMEIFQEVRSGSIMEMEIGLQDTILNVEGTVAHVRPAEDGRFVVGIQFPQPIAALENVVAGNQP